MNKSANIEIRYVLTSDRAFWLSLDKHLPPDEFDKKVRDKQGYVLLLGGKRIGILRYNLFWDNTPFCTLLYISDEYRHRGYGKMLMDRWEQDMQSSGYDFILTSTQSDEAAQHFYRAIGYADCGCLLAPDQPTELFLSKHLSPEN